ncbi:MAG: VOC family protein [Flavobacteriales bacterium]|nr:VOC family protein [Flavobacteriales bacterium]
MGSTAAASKNHIRLKDFVSWFEIPVYDIHRATAFYNAIYNMEMEVAYNGDFAMAYFPAENGIGGALVQGPGCIPNDTGTLIYLNASFDMDNILARIDLSGGRVIMTKTLISESAGSFALFIDSEGNRMALHEGPRRSSVTSSKPAAKKVAKKAAPKEVLAKKKAAGRAKL